MQLVPQYSTLLYNRKSHSKGSYRYDFNQTYNDVKFIWNTNVPDPGYMFAGCSYITEVDLSHFDTSQATNFRYIFTDCISITSINLSNIDTSNAI